MRSKVRKLRNRKSLSSDIMDCINAADRRLSEFGFANVSQGYQEILGEDLLLANTTEVEGLPVVKDKKYLVPIPELNPKNHYKHLMNIACGARNDHEAFIEIKAYCTKLFTEARKNNANATTEEEKV